MILREFGNTGIMISPLGFGAGEIGDFAVGEKQVELILNFALDSGINLIDTARGYYASEGRIGQFISHRRKEFILSTKVGYGIPGHADWSYDSVRLGIEDALRVMKTDYIDIVHLHSCTLETLQKGEVIEALNKSVESGKVRFGAYSGENEALKFAVESGAFRSVQTSLNLFDQRNIDNVFPQAISKGYGVIAKRPIANAPWRFIERPYGNYAEEYWLRWKKMSEKIDVDWAGAALRFTAFSEGVSTAITGTTNIDHLKNNIEAVNMGRLDESLYSLLRSAFKECDDNWIGQV